jgi:hypothetical protein
LSRAAQSIEIISDDISSLNKRLNWQIINQSRDLKYVRLNQTFLRLVIFTDSSFVNNSDLSSQIDYVICLADATHANILHWSSIKYKRVTRSVLAVEFSLAVGSGFGQKFKPDPRVDVLPDWTDQRFQFDSRIDVRRILSSLFDVNRMQ